MRALTYELSVSRRDGCQVTGECSQRNKQQVGQRRELMPPQSASLLSKTKETMEAAKWGNNGTISFMTFGDGDFSYSLDLTKYLTSSKERHPTRVICSGIDSLEEVIAKYRDAPFLLKQLQSLNDEDSFSLTVRHGVNAVQPPPASEEKQQWKAHHVIFNHPHVGTEDAALHSRFLSHFLHTASLYWMKENGGVLHLTLVKGQYERWKCEEAAERHGLILLERNPFVPPPGGHYQHRRHQTGKSFASRATGGSETFTFGRKSDKEHDATCLPWQHMRHHATNDNQEEYPCPHCEKSFREERSLKSHTKAVHSNQEGSKKRKRVAALQCQQCKALNNTVRMFPHEQALQDHVRAKHAGPYSTIQPDWVKTDVSNGTSRTVEEQKALVSDSCDSERTANEPICFGSCSICGYTYRTEKDESHHLIKFIPVATSGVDSQDTSCTFQCSFCDKGFRDQRAKRQHENFCVDKSTVRDEQTNNAAHG